MATSHSSHSRVKAEEDLAAVDDDVRELVAARDGQASSQIGHGATI